MPDCLILNANYQPLSWLPLSVISWQQAVKLHYMEKIKVLEWYADWEVHSPSTTLKVPALAITRDYHNFLNLFISKKSNQRISQHLKALKNFR
jgi:hypothetical protein